MAFGETLRGTLAPAAALIARAARGRPGRIALWALAIGFFVFALAFPMLYVFEEAFRIPPPRYSVRAGQSLNDFALEHRASREDLRVWNGLAPDEEVEPGRALKIGPDSWGLGHFRNLVSDPTSRGWLGLTVPPPAPCRTSS